LTASAVALEAPGQGLNARFRMTQARRSDFALLSRRDDQKTGDLAEQLASLVVGLEAGFGAIVQSMKRLPR
jgi:hypothetical protein